MGVTGTSIRAWRVVAGLTTAQARARCLLMASAFAAKPKASTARCLGPDRALGRNLPSTWVSSTQSLLSGRMRSLVARF